MPFSSELFFVVSVLLFCGRQSLQADKLLFSFGAKTPYHYNDSSFSKPPKCQAVHINMVLRHGSRYPAKDEQEYFDEILKTLSDVHGSESSFRYEDLSLPWEWSADWGNADDGELAKRGEREHYEIARRYSKRFPGIFFNRAYWNKRFQFVTTDKARTAQSAMSFAFGLFQGEGPLGSSKFQPVALKFSGPKKQDNLLSPSGACPRYKEEMNENNGSRLQEYTKFKGGQVARVSEILKKRLNVSEKTEIKAEVLFKLCAFVFSLENDPSWCSLFQKEDADVLQYLGDLEAYYKHSYGNELGYKITCKLIAHITDTLTNFTRDGLPLGIFRFAHSRTIISLLTAFGLFKDPLPLRADNYAKQSARKFRTSKISPMAANAAFVLYRCNATGDVKAWKVQLLINETPVGMPCCNGNSICSLKKFLSCYQPIGEKCHFDSMCKLAPKGSAEKVQSPVFTIFIFYSLVTAVFSD